MCQPPPPETPCAPRVLVVEDDQFVREVTDYELARAGFTVASAPDGPSALAAVQREMPDAVVLDLRMPGMSGKEVLRELKSLNPRLPVFIFSVFGDFPEVVESLSEADGCFAKSSDLAPLIRAITHAVCG